MGLEAGSKLCRILGEDETAELCEAKVAVIRGAGVPDPNGNKRAAAMLLLSGIATGRDADDLIAMIKEGGAKGMSTFLGFYVLNALSERNETKAALDIIRTFWGAMLSRGATTFWEDFSMDWLEGTGRIDELVKPGEKDIHGDFGAYCYKGFRHSLCHGWASGPAAYLSHYVLGIEVLEPGCKKVRVRPDLGDLDFAEGTYPTPYGVIRVRHEKDASGTIISHIDAPAEVEVVQG